MTVSQISTQLRPTQQPRLPVAPVEYDRSYIDALTGILRLYFNQLDNYTQSSLTNTGGRFSRNVCGSFYDTTTQNAAVANTAYKVTLNSTDSAISNGVSIVSNSRITVVYPGVYNIQFSAQFTRSNSGTDVVSVWFAKNGVNIDNSCTDIVLTGGAAASATVASWNYFISLNAGDYFEIVWSTPDTHVSITYGGTRTSPVRPAVPSVIATVSFVSAPLT
jgi:hypothetical protein